MGESLQCIPAWKSLNDSSDHSCGDFRKKGMPRQSAIDKARCDQKEGKSASTQAGEFIQEEIDLIRRGAHGVRSTKQAIAIGLSKARRAGVKLQAPKRGAALEQARQKAKRDLANSKNSGLEPVSKKRSRAALDALKHEGRTPVSKSALAQQARAAAHHRTPAERSASAKKAARTRATHTIDR